MTWNNASEHWNADDMEIECISVVAVRETWCTSLIIASVWVKRHDAWKWKKAYKRVWHLPFITPSLTVEDIQEWLQGAGLEDKKLRHS